MNNATEQWRRWHQTKPEDGYRISLRSPGYTGEAHVFGERLRPWNPVSGYDNDLDPDESVEWMPLLDNGLPSRFAVD
jgi:hypothetical protein